MKRTSSDKPKIISLFAGNKEHPMPSWLQYFFDIGWLLADSIKTHNYRIVLCVPARCLASLFVTAGYLMHKSRLATPGGNLEHFKALCNLEPWDQVTVIHNGRTYKKAIFCGACELLGQKQIKVMLQEKDKSFIYFNEDRADNVIIANKKVSEVPHSQPGRVIETNEDFLSLAFGENNYKQFTLASQSSCEIFCHINELRNELEAVRLTLCQSHRNEQGTLKDLVRIKDLSEVGYGYHTNVLSVMANELRDEDTANKAEMVIFDGATGYLKWRNVRRAASTVLILDRSERLFEDAVNTVKEDYLINRNGEELLQEIPPAGIEAMAYYE